MFKIVIKILPHYKLRIINYFKKRYIGRIIFFMIARVWLPHRPNEPRPWAHCCCGSTKCNKMIQIEKCWNRNFLNFNFLKKQNIFWLTLQEYLNNKISPMPPPINSNIFCCDRSLKRCWTWTLHNLNRALILLLITEQNYERTFTTAVLFK